MDKGRESSYPIYSYWGEIMVLLLWVQNSLILIGWGGGGSGKQTNVSLLTSFSDKIYIFLFGIETLGICQDRAVSNMPFLQPPPNTKNKENFCAPKYFYIYEYTWLNPKVALRTISFTNIIPAINIELLLRIITSFHFFATFFCVSDQNARIFVLLYGSRKFFDFSDFFRASQNDFFQWSGLSPPPLSQWSDHQKNNFFAASLTRRWNGNMVN